MNTVQALVVKALVHVFMIVGSPMATEPAGQGAEGFRSADVVEKALQQSRAITESLPPGSAADEFKAALLEEIAIAWVEAGQVPEAIKTVSLIPWCGDFRVFHHINALLVIADAQARQGAVESFSKAVELTQRIKEPRRRVAPLTIIAGAQARGGQREQAAATLELAIKGAETIPLVLRFTDRTAEGNKAIALAQIAIVQRQLEDRGASEATWNQAIVAAEAIENPVTREGTWIYLGNARSDAGEVEAGLEMVRRGLAPEGGPKERDLSVTTSLRIAEREKAGDDAGALRLMAAIDNPDQQCTAYLKAAQRRFESGRHDAAGELIQKAVVAADRIDDPGVRALRLAHIAQQQAQQGDLAEAATMIHRAETAIDQGGGPVLDRVRRAIAGPDDRLIEKHAIALSHLARARSLLGATGPSRETIARAEKLAATIKDRLIRGTAVMEVAIAAANVGEIELADRLYRLIPEEYNGFRDRAFREIFLARAQVGDLEGALHALEPCPVLRPKTVSQGDNGTLREYAELVQIVGKDLAKRDVPKARDWAERQSQPLLKARAFLGLAQGLLRNTVAAKGGPRR